MSDTDKPTAIALFRYTLILPLLRGQYPPGGKQELRRQIAAQHHDIPHSSRHSVSTTTLARWERIYREEGFEALAPDPLYGHPVCDAKAARLWAANLVALVSPPLSAVGWGGEIRAAGLA